MNLEDWWAEQFKNNGIEDNSDIVVNYQQKIDKLKEENKKLRELLKKAGEGSHRCKELYDWYCKEITDNSK